MAQLSFISQRDSRYADCFPISVCNCLRFLGIKTPRPNTKAWERVVDVAGCRHGTTMDEYGVAKFLGAKIIRVKHVEHHLPVILTVLTPEIGHHLHCVAVIDADDDRYEVVDYRIGGRKNRPLISWLTVKSEKEAPRKQGGHLNRRKFGKILYLYEGLGPPPYKVVPLEQGAGR